MNAWGRTVVASVLILGLSMGSVSAFGPEGHQMIGAIAEKRLAGTHTLQTAHDLLQGMTLDRAAKLADDIKAWDKKPPLDPDSWHLPSEFAQLEADLLMFWQANRTKHHDFHFTDVPVEGSSKYSTGTTGRSDHDLVHMIPYCVKVLDGTIMENDVQQNPKRITKRVAVALLAHYVGDLHQPLHVGAQYFDDNGAPTNPDTHSGMGHGDTGGNNLLFVFEDAHGREEHKNLHSFWDGNAFADAMDEVRTAMRTANPALTGAISNDQLATYLGTQGSTGGLPAGTPLENVVISWADEILVPAREAHQRLDYFVQIVHGKASGRVSPKNNTGDYSAFAGDTIEASVPKAGARLADLLKKALP